MLTLGQRNSSKRLTTELDARNLDHNGDDQDENEERVVKEVLEDVDLGLFQLSGIDFVEDLHQDESVEEDTVMSSILVVPVSGVHSNG